MIFAVACLIVGAAWLALAYALHATSRSLRQLPKHPGGFAGALEAELAHRNAARTYPPRADHAAAAIDVEEVA